MSDRCLVSSLSVPGSVAGLEKAGTSLKMKEISSHSAGAEASWFSGVGKMPFGTVFPCVFVAQASA